MCNECEYEQWRSHNHDGPEAWASMARILGAALIGVFIVALLFVVK